MDEKKFQTMLKACPKKTEAKLFRLAIIKGVESWRPAALSQFYRKPYVPYTGRRKRSSPGHPNPNKGKKRDPAIVAKIKASNAARRAALKP